MISLALFSRLGNVKTGQGVVGVTGEMGEMGEMVEAVSVVLLKLARRGVGVLGVEIPGTRGVFEEIESPPRALGLEELLPISLDETHNLARCSNLMLVKKL